MALLVGMLALALLVPAVVLGDPEITYITGFQVQNLSGSTANVEIIYYNQDGSIAATMTDTIAAYSSETYFGATMPVGAGFNGSVVVSSDQPVQAIGNIHGDSYAFNASYGGVDEVSTRVNLPLIFRNHAGFNTFFNVQNAGTTTTTAQVRYIPGAVYGNAYTETVQIPPGAAYTFNQADETNLGPNFLGSAIVTGTQDLAVVVNQLDATTLLTYKGFTAGSTEIAVPLFHTNNPVPIAEGGYFCGLQVQNVGSSPTTVHVQFTPGVAGSPLHKSKPADPGEAVTFMPIFGGATFVGSAVVTNTTGQELVAIVNQNNLTLNKGSSYSGFDPADGTNKVSLPLVMDRNYGWYTSVNIQNYGEAGTTVTMTFSASAYTKTLPIDAKSSTTFFHLNKLGSGYVGSGVVEGPPGANIFVVLNEGITPDPGTADTLMTYNGFNY